MPELIDPDMPELIDPDMPELIDPEDTYVQLNPAYDENDDFEIQEIYMNIDEIDHLQNFMSIYFY
jgi:hypothetical protein